jgi:hypothetical protein
VGDESSSSEDNACIPTGKSHRVSTTHPSCTRNEAVSLRDHNRNRVFAMALVEEIILGALSRIQQSDYSAEQLHEMQQQEQHQHIQIPETLTSIPSTHPSKHFTGLTKEKREQIVDNEEESVTGSTVNNADVGNVTSDECKPATVWDKAISNTMPSSHGSVDVTANLISLCSENTGDRNVASETRHSDFLSSYHKTAGFHYDDNCWSLDDEHTHHDMSSSVGITTAPGEEDLHVQSSSSEATVSNSYTNSNDKTERKSPHRLDHIDYTWQHVNEEPWNKLSGFTSRSRSIMEEFFQANTDDTKLNTVGSSNDSVVAPATVIVALPSASKKIGDDDTNYYCNHPATARMLEPSYKIEEDIMTAPSIVATLNNRTDAITILEENDSSISDTSDDNQQLRSFSPAVTTLSATFLPISTPQANDKEKGELVEHVHETDSSLSILCSTVSCLSGPASSLSIPTSPQTFLSGNERIPEFKHDKLRQTKSESKEETHSTSDLGEKSSTIGSPKQFSRDDNDLKIPRVYKSVSVSNSLQRRDHLTRFMKSRDDYDIRHDSIVSFQQSDKALPKTIPSPDGAAYQRSASERRVARLSEPLISSTRLVYGKDSRELCVRSEAADDGNDDYQHWHDSRRQQQQQCDDTKSYQGSKDGSATIASAMSPRESTEDPIIIREERDTFRDMCLTLGAEVAKLKNMLAAQKSSSVYPVMECSQPMPPFYMAFAPDSVAPLFHRSSKAQTMAAMSDAGYRGDHESLASEDELAIKTISSSKPNLPSVTTAGSDLSIEHSMQFLCNSGASFAPKDFYGIASSPNMQSRLSRDILQFLQSTTSSLKKQEPKRRRAIDRMTRLVNTLWPRAQVKLYGSHVTGLCLPSSDMDFVICLPAVHKNAPAVAPGALEGRNAINETSQKLLARKLKSESWIDPRTMKLIDRTAVPVIKVTTKDLKSQVLKLDITFDAPGHHGLEAIDLVLEIIEELPMIQPLVLVLKQFLLDRGLLTAYTGGISSYCLFLMCGRYLQEQQSSWSDCGSLLMGFLDFYGNCVSTHKHIM